MYPFYIFLHVLSCISKTIKTKYCSPLGFFLPNFLPTWGGGGGWTLLGVGHSSGSPLDLKWWQSLKNNRNNSNTHICCTACNWNLAYMKDFSCSFPWFSLLHLSPLYITHGQENTQIKQLSILLGSGIWREGICFCVYLFSFVTLFNCTFA